MEAIILMQEQIVIEEGFEHTLELWGHALFWAFLGIATFKGVLYLFVDLTFWQWLKKYKIIKDVIVGLLLTLCVIKLGDWVVHIIQYIRGGDTGTLGDIAKAVTNGDPVRLALLVAVLFQIFLFKKRKKKVSEE